MNMDNLKNGFIVMTAGIGCMFLVLVLFFFMIKMLIKLFPEDAGFPEKTKMLIRSTYERFFKSGSRP